MRLKYESLEARHLLAAELGFWQSNNLGQQNLSAPSITWVEAATGVQRIPLASLASVDRLLPEGVAGPIPMAAGEWIVQLRDDAARTVHRLAQADALLDDLNNDFTIISGLGARGAILIRGDGPSRADIEASLRANPHVQTYHLNQMVQGQTLTPNDPDFIAGQLPGLNTIGAPAAWSESVGSMNTVVGVVDSGIDPTHTDLYLNIWLNQGEIPRRFLEGDGDKLVDIDSDGLITFYDLNNVTRSTEEPYSLIFGGWENGPNAQFVNDLNGNGRIDAADLLLDANWADGRDTDGNGFFDDLFGVNFRAGAGDPFSRNNPSDQLGHGTHVAGTIGAIGGNGTGVVGVNWQTSLMSLRILDNNNQGDSGAAIAAINYARMMRERLRTDVDNRVTEGANVRVLNNSWGQPGGYEASLEAAIEQLYGAGILFVAAAGNGNILGQGVDNDRTPFYPASYDVPNVISVAAADANDRLATFSNFGRTSVDILAPGVGIRSTVPGGGYQSANGTSMAAPHVAGTAGLIWSALPEATVDEITQAIRTGIAAVTQPDVVATGGSLNTLASITADVFAPAARLIAKQDITTVGGTATEFTIEYSHRDGVALASIGDDDIIVTRHWGPKEVLAATLSRPILEEDITATTLKATYRVTAPGGFWDALDFGDYLISTQAGNVVTEAGARPIQSRDIGRFNVRITNDSTIAGHDPSVIYVDQFVDSLESGSLRSAIIAANNAFPSPRTIILATGKYTIDIPHAIDPQSTFGTSLVSLGLPNNGGWSNATTGDFDLRGNITIVGDTNEETIIDGQGIDRVFKVDADSNVTLSRLTIQGGVSPVAQGGGGVLSIGSVKFDNATLRENAAVGINPTRPLFGGAIAVWAGEVEVDQTWVTENRSDFGGGLFVSGAATLVVNASTFDANEGGGIYSSSSSDGIVENSTFSGNVGGYGAVANGIKDSFLIANNESRNPSISANGRFIAFESSASNLVFGDRNNSIDVFVYDRQTGTIERVSVNSDGAEGNRGGSTPSISADGRFVAFQSNSSSLVPGATETRNNVFVYDRDLKSLELVSFSQNEPLNQSNSHSNSPSISADGRYVAFLSDATDLVTGDFNGKADVFILDRDTRLIERISVNNDGAEANGFSYSPSISGDGRYVAFSSDSNNLVPGDTNGRRDIFVFDREQHSIERVSVDSDGTQAESDNFNPSLSHDGRYVAFESASTYSISGTLNGAVQVYVHDRETGLIERVSVNDLGVAGNSTSTNASFSNDGRLVTFISAAANLVVNDTNQTTDVFVFDRTDRTIDRININADGGEGNGESFSASLSADGRYGVFSSRSNNLFPDDTNAASDVFFFDRSSNEIAAITIRPQVSSFVVSSSTIAFTSGTSENAAVYGDVAVKHSLFLENEVLSDVNSRNLPVASFNNIMSNTSGAELVEPLQRTGSLPPVHRLIQGNPAIDSGNPELNGSRDQIGTLRIHADVGAVEAISGSIFGKVYADLNVNGVLDEGEPGIPGVVVKVTGDADSVVVSRHDDSQIPLVNETGTFVIADLPVGSYHFEPQVITGWSTYRPPLDIVRSTAVQPNSDSLVSQMSEDGRFVVFQSFASNLVGADTNELPDIFVYDRTTDSIERVSVSNSGDEANDYTHSPAISADGRYVTFSSRATNLVPEKGTTVDDIFVFDRVTKLIERVSISDGGDEGNSFSFSPRISRDGRYVTFGSYSSNLVPGDTNGQPDIFVYDRSTDTIERLGTIDFEIVDEGDNSAFALSADRRYITFASSAGNLVPGDTNEQNDIFVFDQITGSIERVSVSSLGEQANGASIRPSISDDGRYVAFTSHASNLVPEDTNGESDVFVFDRVTDSIERVSIGHTGAQGNDFSTYASLSADGRYVAFSSFANNLVPDDTNGSFDDFVFDRVTRSIARVNVSDTGVQGSTNTSGSITLSGDGRFIAFSSADGNLVAGDANSSIDVFIASNPLLQAGTPLSLEPGEVYDDLNLGLVPNPGAISGRVFVDVVENGVFDNGEPTVEDVFVFIDSNGNGIHDETEPSALTTNDGRFEFNDLGSFQLYSVLIRPPFGFEITSPGSSENFGYHLFLPAGGIITNRDFALQFIQATGQSSASQISGRLFDDLNGNGVFDAGVDHPLSGQEVFLDASNFGVRDDNEPRTLTDSQGRYSFDGLSARNVAVTTVLDQTLVHVNPLGSDFELARYPLFSEVVPFGNPQAIALADFNDDGFLDAAVALGEANMLSIRLNDGDRGFLPDEIDIELGTNGAGPTSLVVGQFDHDSRVDVALTANFSGFVTILLNFDPSLKTFTSIAYVKVGEEPLDLVAGDFTGDHMTDLVVVNRADNTVQLLTNNGSGLFFAGPGVPTGGRNSGSIVVGDFTGDGLLDVAVAHASSSSVATAFGGVTILRGNTDGDLTLIPEFYTVGATPTDSVAGDFNGDGRADIAIANFSSNSISILLGQADGTLRVQTEILGTASGAFDIAVADIDNDGDIDVIASNLRDRNISIFRNIGVDSTTGDVRFEPLENIGLGQFSLAQRMPLAVGNFDNDASGPGGAGTIDIVTIPQRTDTLNVLNNSLVNGAHRVALTGLNVVSDRDFIIKPAILSPTFDPIATPLPILEDAGPQSVTITNIAQGRSTGPALRFIVTSDNPTVIPSPGQTTFSGGTSTTFSFEPVTDANGTALLTVRAIDAGADGLFDTDDDGTFARSFTVSVLPVNDPPAFTVPVDVTVTQEAGPQAFAGFITALGPGGAVDEGNQQLDAFTITADNRFFIAPPAIDANGQLTFSPSPNKSGPVPITVSVSDDGGRSNGGVDTTTRTFVINILPVNDPPTIRLAGDQTVRAEGGLREVLNFATGFHPGGGEDEASQIVSDFIVTVDRPGLFAVLPSISVNGTLTYAPAIDRTGLATVGVQVRDSGGRANGGNDLSELETFTIAVTPVPDTVRSTPVILPGVPAITDQATFEVEVDFGEPVTGFTLADVMVSSGTKSALEDLTGGKFRFTYSGADGNVTFSIAEHIVNDLSGNPNFAAVPVVRTIDTVGVTASLGSTVAGSTNATSFTVGIEFGEAVVGFTLSDLVVLNGSATSLVPINASTGSYSVTITPTTDGTLTVLLPAGVVTDAAGNINSAADPLIRMIDRIRPTVNLTTNVPAVTNRTTFDVFAQFSEPVTDLNAAGLEITGGSLGEPQFVSPGVFRIPITAAVGAIQARVVEAAVNDLAGNASLASNELTITVDPAVAFTPVITSSSPAALNSNAFAVSVDFGTQVNNFTLNNLGIVNGSAAGLTPVDASLGRYAFTVTAFADGPVNVLISADAVTDLAGNRNSASNVLLRTIDSMRPEPTLSVPFASITNQSTIDVTVDFGEAVNGFELSDLVVNGATLSNLRLISGGRYLVTASASHGTMRISLPTGSVTDLAGNTNVAATPLVRTIDLLPVTVTLNSSIAAISNVDHFLVSIDFAKQVTGFTASSLIAFGGEVSDLETIDAIAGRYSVRVTPTADGTLTVLLPANAATDLVGNGNLAAAPLVRTIDRVAPVVTLSTSQGSPTVERTFAVIVQSSKAISGLTTAAFNVTGGSIGQPQSLGDGRYSVAVTATGGLFELSVRGGAVTDAAGNVNAASNVVRIEVTPQTPILTPTVDGQSIDLAAMADADLVNVEMIDLRGFGDNLLTLDSDKIRNLFANSSVTVYADSGDTILFDGDWRFQGIELVGGEVHRVFTNSGATIRTIGPRDFTNPQNQFDVDGSGEVVALDALHVLTSIRAKQIVDSQGGFLPLTAENQSSFQFVDVNQDNVLTPLDALLVLIEMRRIANTASGPSGEQVIAPPPPISGLIAIEEAGDDYAVEPHNTRNIPAEITGDFTRDDFLQRTEMPQVGNHDSDKIDEASHNTSLDSFLLVDQAFADPELLDEKR